MSEVKKAKLIQVFFVALLATAVLGYLCVGVLFSTNTNVEDSSNVLLRAFATVFGFLGEIILAPKTMLGLLFGNEVPLFSGIAFSAFIWASITTIICYLRSKRRDTGAA